MSWLTIVLVCYVIGSLPTAYLMGRVTAGVDIRVSGDGNAGAANVYREVGHIPGIAVGVMDVGKGTLAVLIAGVLQPQQSFALIGGAAAVMGHNWPLFLQLRGGRGAATTMGVLVALLPQVVFPLIVVAGVPFVLYRSVNLFFAFLYTPLPGVLWFLQYPGHMIWYAIALPLLVGVTHYLTTRGVHKPLQEPQPD
ncbi:MAG: glycerol-3-phosphate acyltransferase [Chloroflexi bacterium]|nr:glycerol-3-phosphate acyltransferase [Chloroflexota bacterium]